MKPVVVFLDGFAFHHDRIGHDMAQRMAIVQSGKYLTWSLSWHDVENRFNPLKPFFQDFMDPSGLPSGGTLKELITGYGLNSLKTLHTQNSFDLLVRFLENPDEEQWRRFLFVAGLLHVDAGRFGDESAVKEWMQGVAYLLPEQIADTLTDTNCPGLHAGCLYGAYEFRDLDNHPLLRQYVVVEKKAVVPPGDPTGIGVGCWLNDHGEASEQPGFKAVWNGFLRLYNVYQFLHRAFFVTARGNDARAYDTITLFDPSKTADVAAENTALDGWDEVKELTDVQYHGLLDDLKDNDWPVPEAGYELAADNDEIIAGAEIGWEDMKIALLTEDENEFQETFLNRGWYVFAISDMLNDIHPLLSMKEVKKADEKGE
jgi:DEAD/DEAH box helicase domain-containing protein